MMNHCAGRRGHQPSAANSLGTDRQAGRFSEEAFGVAEFTHRGNISVATGCEDNNTAEVGDGCCRWSPARCRTGKPDECSGR